MKYLNVVFYYWLSLEYQIGLFALICIQSMSRAIERLIFRRYRLKIISAKLMAVRKYCRVFSIHTYVILKQMHSARRKWFENWIDLCMNWFFHGGLYCYHKSLDHANFILRLENDGKHRYEKTIMVIFYVLKTTKLYDRLYDTRFCVVSFHIHDIYIQRRRFG